MSSTTRVLHFVEATAGGVLSVILDSIEQLRSEHPDRFEFTVLYSDREETPSNLQAMHPEVSFQRLAVGRRFFSIRDLGLVWRVARYSRDFDVVHCHSSRAGFIGRLSRLVGGRRVLYSPHCYGFLSEEFSRFKRACIYLTEKMLARVPGATTVACGDSEYRLARRLGGRALMVRNGCAPMSAGNQRKGTGAPGAVRVIGAGRDSLQKDPGLFLDVASRFPGSGVSFTWVGPLRKGGVATGWVSRDVAQSIIAEGDVFLMTSRWEGLPVVGLEAMSVGMPLVVRNVPGARDLVVDGVNGYLFDSPDEAASHVARLMGDAGLREDMGRESRIRFETLFSRRNYLALERVYCADARVSG